MSICLSINWALWSLYILYFFLVKQYISGGHHHKNTDPICSWHKMPLIQWGHGIQLTTINLSHEVLFNKCLENLLPHILHNCGVVAKPLGHFPLWLSSGFEEAQHSPRHPAHSLCAPGAAERNAKCFITCFRLQKVAFCVVLSPVTLIMTKTGAAQPAPELDGFSGSCSAPNMPGNSIQVLTVASGGAACLDYSRTMVLLPLLIFEQCVCQLR